MPKTDYTYARNMRQYGVGLWITRFGMRLYGPLRVPEVRTLERQQPPCDFLDRFPELGYIDATAPA